tara:strand:+ start:139 stop:384 length:246 start_codon:yes stop_codon:yes gene_type:complete
MKKMLYDFMFDNQIPFTYPPYSEMSLMKKIDIKYLKFVKEFIKKNKLQLRVRYRGSSTDNYRRNPSYVLMNNAQTFALYER